MTVWQRLASVNLSVWVIAGALAGILCGAFFGEYAAALEPIGATYVMLLQMVVFPFLVSSLLHGLGRLTPATAWRLCKSGVPLLFLAWAVIIGALFLLAQAIPAARPPVVVKAGAGDGVGSLVSLLIPANPFIDLTQNYVPAIVVFCIFYGVAIQSIEKKQSLLDILDAFRRASVTIWRWVVKIAPLGVFALFANLAGTIELQLIGGLLLYAGLFIGASLILALWVLPSLLSAIAPVTYREIMRELQDGLVVAVVTSLPITAVPHIISVAERLVKRQKVEDAECNDVISTTMAVSYPFAQVGNLFVIFFIVFAAFYVHASLPGAAWVSLPVFTVLSTVGTPVSTVNAVAFIAQYLGMPADIKLLYVDLMTLTRYPQVLLSTMGIAFVTILVSFAYYRLLKVSAPRLILCVAISAALMVGFTVAGRSVAPNLTAKQPNPYLAFTLGGDLTSAVHATIHRAPPEGSAQGTEPPAPGATMARVRASGVLRVGYGPAVIPFSYDNAKGDLVGYDISLAYALARDLGVELAFYPITDWETLTDALRENRFDLALGGIYVSPQRLKDVAVSATYLDTPPALIVHAADAEKFAARTGRRPSAGLRIVRFKSVIIADLANRMFPGATFETVPDYGALREVGDFDAAVWTLEQAKAWAEAHDGYSAVVPKDAGPPLAIAFLMPPNSAAFLRYLNEWLELQRVNGRQGALNAYWLEGKPRKSSRPRWSILRNVLGWTD